MNIKFNDFHKQYLAQKLAYNKALTGVLESGYYILGSQVASFEKSLASYLGVKYIVGVANGLEALQLSLMALNIGPGDEVITTCQSAVATALAIKAVGATPVFVDIDECHHINSELIESKINTKTRAIIPVHLYGQAVAIDKLKVICKKYKLFLIEDCAQALGATFKNKKLGSFGDLAAFSFYPTKNLGACGDGGAIATSDKKVYEKLLALRNYGQKNRYEHEFYGLNSRLDEIQAAFLNVQLKKLDTYNKKRQKMARLYSQLLRDVKEIYLPKVRNNSQPVWHLFVIEAERRDSLQTYLKSKNIPTLIHYPILISKQKCFKEYNVLKFPIAEAKIKKIISLPIHPFMTELEIKYICAQIKFFYKS